MCLCSYVWWLACGCGSVSVCVCGCVWVCGGVGVCGEPWTDWVFWLAAARKFQQGQSGISCLWCINDCRFWIQSLQKALEIDPWITAV